MCCPQTHPQNSKLCPIHTAQSPIPYMSPTSLFSRSWESCPWTRAHHPWAQPSILRRKTKSYEPTPYLHNPKRVNSLLPTPQLPDTHCK